MPSTTAEMLTAQIAAQAEAFESINADDYDSLWEIPLEVTVHRQVHVLLTYGGPTIWAEADLDDDGQVTNARLMGAWGTDQATCPVSHRSALWTALQEYAETVMTAA